MPFSSRSLSWPAAFVIVAVIAAAVAVVFATPVSERKDAVGALVSAISVLGFLVYMYAMFGRRRP